MKLFAIVGGGREKGGRAEGRAGRGWLNEFVHFLPPFLNINQRFFQTLWRHPQTGRQRDDVIILCDPSGIHPGFFCDSFRMLFFWEGGEGRRGVGWRGGGRITISRRWLLMDFLSLRCGMLHPLIRRFRHLLLFILLLHFLSFCLPSHLLRERSIQVTFNRRMQITNPIIITIV